ncbi:MAG: 1-aminocyclopropane-1-carboxylate deaminase [Saprospiraceae bacterium]|jgi:1-aminocyclopropane-1-carboxylate deaminase/D-cysteine desulfhydrase-like pyridoxal-dependent ACC family enzyme
MILQELAFGKVEQALKQLSAAYPDHQLYLKRDDCTGLAMGGNKARQLEFYLGDALAQSCDVDTNSNFPDQRHG